MTKKEILKINSIKSITMKEARMFNKDAMKAQAFKHGFNLARRKIRKVLFGIITKNI